MKKIFRKNQIIITALALMIAVAGYLQYSKNMDDKSTAKEASSDLSDDTYEISDEDMFNADDIFTDTEDNGEAAATEGVVSEGTEGAAGTQGLAENGTDAASGTPQEGSQGDTDAIDNPGEAVLTSSTVGNLDFAAEVKLNREQIRSKNKESLLEVINNAGLTEAQKQEAVDSMIRMTDVAEREAAAEMLLEAKGFSNVVVSITDDNVDVVLNMGDVTDAKRAQVEDIVKRKTNIVAENIVITPIQVTANDAANVETEPEK